MELEDDDFMQIVSEVVREFGQVTTKREATQPTVECMVKRVVLFNGNKVPFYLEAYNAEMGVRSVNDALRLTFFLLGRGCRNTRGSERPRRSP